MQLACELRAEYVCNHSDDVPISRHSQTLDYVQPADQVLFCKNLANVDIAKLPNVMATKLHMNVQSVKNRCVIHVERQLKLFASCAKKTRRLAVSSEI